MHEGVACYQSCKNGFELLNDGVLFDGAGRPIIHNMAHEFSFKIFCPWKTLRLAGGLNMKEGD